MPNLEIWSLHDTILFPAPRPQKHTGGLQAPGDQKTNSLYLLMRRHKGGGDKSRKKYGQPYSAPDNRHDGLALFISEEKECRIRKYQRGRDDRRDDKRQEKKDDPKNRMRLDATHPNPLLEMPSRDGKDTDIERLSNPILFDYLLDLLERFC